MGQPAGSFTVALGESLKACLVAAARAAGTTPSVLARRAVAEAVGEVAGGDETAASASRNEEPLTEIRVRVPQSAAVRLAAASRACGLTRTAYVSAAMVELAERSASRPGVTAAEAGIESAGALREALVRSNATLAPIGRNLNQVARALNMRSDHTPAADRTTLADLAHRVSQHLELASELLHAIRVPRTPAARTKTAHPPG